MAASTSGIIAGMNPLIYSSSSPYTMFFFQLMVILVISHLLYIPLSKIKQPRVLAEVLTGIVLSHTVLGRIPNFTKYVFPTESISGLTLVANIGICLLMFIVGCEVDIKFIKKHLVTALTVGIFNMAVPFGLGCACAVGLWNDYRVHVEGLPHIKFTTFMVFIATAMCITAFPVLVRILTELRLVKDRVGTVVLAAGITNDLLGWILLALSITLANEAQSLVTLYIVLVAIGWCIFICYPIRIALHYFLKNILKEFDNHNSPSRLAMMIILLMVFASAFFTDIIGVHPIFGAFIVGTIVPRENNYVINLTSRIEDLVNIIFVPVYFAIAGLDVDLGLLNKGLDWGWAFGLIGIALVGKIFGGLVAAKFQGLYWRESLTVGVLMSCKGIVEIVVLQIGLKAQIISQKTYSMFIFMALITTFLTTPMTIYCYPSSYREKVQLWLAEKQKLEEADTSPENEKNSTDGNGRESLSLEREINISSIIITVNDIESASSGLFILDMLLERTNIPVHAINLKTLTERTADLLHASMIDGSTSTQNFNSLNPILSIFKIFCHFNKIPFRSEILYSLPENNIKTLFDNPSFISDDLFMMSLPKRDYSAAYFMEIINESKGFTYHKGIIINNNQELNMDDDNEGVDDTKNMETKSYFSDNTILNPLALKISTITLYFTNTKLTRQDRLAMKLFDILIHGNDLTMAKVIVSNLDRNSELYIDIEGWVNGNREMFKNIKFSFDDIYDGDENSATGRSSIKHPVKNETECTTPDSLLIIPTECDIEMVTNLVETHDKILVLF